MRALGFVLLVSTVGCGGRLIDEESSSAPAVDAGANAPASSSTSTTPGSLPTGAADAGAPPPYTPTSPTSFSLDVTGCSGRSWGSPGATGYATTIVDEWVRARVAECGGAPSCGTLTVHFSRMPSPACVDALTFSAEQPSSFVACLASAMGRERLAAGNFVDGDRRTVSLCK